MTWAVPPDPMVAVVDEGLADAPSTGLTVNVTTPPATGSAGSLAVTVTARGAANAVVVTAPCGVLPATGVRVNPWLSKAPMSTLSFTTRGSPRSSVLTPKGIRL